MLLAQALRAACGRVSPDLENLDDGFERIPDEADWTLDRYVQGDNNWVLEEFLRPWGLPNGGLAQKVQDLNICLRGKRRGPHGVSGRRV